MKYTDYAIGKFIRDVRNEPWFNQTIFVIIADHCASNAGKTELPLNKYHIPLLVYSPANLPAMKIERMISQIDVGPTLCGLLNFTYQSKFLGYDLFSLEVGKERAFISTYQNLGFISNNKLIVLSPRQKIEAFEVNLRTHESTQTIPENRFVNEAIAWYQGSSYIFNKQLLHHIPPHTN
ncbi:MAG: sulfatase-like hydrolase/transferase [Cyclobacteriaceae bacterium]|nr:sulfatase-like hydrolase/transferase [Cyclobacteriaceae bacterium]